MRSASTVLGLEIAGQGAQGHLPDVAVVADGLDETVDRVEVIDVIVEQVAVVSGEKVRHGEVLGRFLHVDELFDFQLSANQSLIGASQPSRLGSECRIVRIPSFAVDGDIFVGGLEEQPLPTLVSFDQNTVEVLFEGVDAVAFAVDLHLDEIVLKSDEAAFSEVFLIDPFLEKVARGGVMNRESTKPVDRFAAFDFDSERPFVGLEMVEPKTSKAQIDAIVFAAEAQLRRDPIRFFEIAEVAPFPGDGPMVGELLKVQMLNGKVEPLGAAAQALNPMDRPVDIRRDQSSSEVPEPEQLIGAIELDADKSRNDGGSEKEREQREEDRRSKDDSAFSREVLPLLKA